PHGFVAERAQIRRNSGRGGDRFGPGSEGCHAGWPWLSGVVAGPRVTDSLGARPCPPVRRPRADPKGLGPKDFRRRTRRTGRAGLSAWSAYPPTLAGPSGTLPALEPGPKAGDVT